MNPYCPGGPMSCQSAPGWVHAVLPPHPGCWINSNPSWSVGGPMRFPWYLFHRLF
ncbi:unnamed protein product [Staurois parvus]|uniref:Uncharacterized protein n=1 Tax=Staurois parvus TaxID=386267 RepID=A0ABN9BZX9_9NEOB|nr:unnamed protein product [Staurois parvus]